MCGKRHEQHDIGLKLYMKRSPPNIERVFGYDNYRRWVAFFWCKQEDASLSFDGYVYTPINALAWQAFFHHPLAVALNHTRDTHGLKKTYEFGDMHVAARHWLVLDRKNSTLFVGEKSGVLDFFHDLLRQIPEDNSTLSGQPIWMAENEFGGSSSIERQEMIDNMIQWLDRRLEAFTASGKWQNTVE
jgi:hypothetical protein